MTTKTNTVLNHGRLNAFLAGSLSVWALHDLSLHDHRAAIISGVLAVANLAYWLTGFREEQ